MHVLQLNFENVNKILCREFGAWSTAPLHWTV